MVLVFILLGTLILILGVIFFIMLSTFHIEIQDLETTNISKNLKEKYYKDNETKNVKTNGKKRKDNGYAVILSLYLFNKIKWIWVNLNDEKMRKLYTKMQLEKIDFKKLEEDFKWEDLKKIKELHPKISYFNLKATLGTESPLITAFIITILSSGIAILLPHFVTDFKKENYQYNIMPIYKNKNLYKIQFNCIIQVKMVHIINVTISFLKKGMSKSNERTTSNRKSYGYSYE